MISSLFNRTSLPALQEAVKFSEARHEVLAGNIANMDTPDYQVRDLSPDVFQQRLREALASRDAASRDAASRDAASQAAASASGSLGLPDIDGDRALREVSDGMESILFHDGSNDGLEQQVLQITQNQFLHNFAVAVMRSQFNLLAAAISERV
jgi:flagellar basal-body rod protein FlgB